MGQVHGHSQLQSPSHKHQQRQAQAITHTQQLRDDLEVRDFDTEIEDSDDVRPLSDDASEESRDPNDLSFRDDSELVPDFSWLRRSPDISRHILPVLPKAQWRLCLKGTAISVHRVGRGATSKATQRREVILKVAGKIQRKYLETGDIDNLQVLEPKTLKEYILSDSSAQDVVATYKDDKSSVTADAKHQYFYALSGAVHAVRFLMQDNICEVAISRVYHALAVIMKNERRDYGKNTLLTDEKIAEKLNDLLGVGGFSATLVRRWRERETNWSFMRIYLPNSVHRGKAYGKSGRG